MLEHHLVVRQVLFQDKAAIELYMQAMIAQSQSAELQAQVYNAQGLFCDSGLGYKLTL